MFQARPIRPLTMLESTYAKTELLQSSKKNPMLIFFLRFTKIMRVCSILRKVIQHQLNDELRED